MRVWLASLEGARCSVVSVEWLIYSEQSKVYEAPLAWSEKECAIKIMKTKWAQIELHVSPNLRHVTSIGIFLLFVLELIVRLSDFSFAIT